ncbi:hypothetical protein [uncultured Sulfitobacter sp.]|uniref:glycosyltransferase family 2 protein n=1 Tax=uncultured Sulfitobacter sp. TaxID=191468 RepID=UPI002601D7A2|nr:hypothetical protein [uncultured Sulfitobacter sp.]
MSQPEGEITSQLASFLSTWARKTRPLSTGEMVTVQGLDCTNPDPDTQDLYFKTGADHVSDVRGLPVTLANQDFLSTDSLRNGFFPDIFRKHTAVNNLHLVLRGKGRFHLGLYTHDTEGSTKLLSDAASQAGSDPVRVSLGADLPASVRLEARVQARSGKSRIDSLTWETAAPRDVDGRMVVLLRTFGRTRDVVALFAQLRREAALGDYTHFLRNTAFVVLDASDGVSKRDYATATAGGMFNIFVYAGANLGGGGNMSQVMLHAREAFAQADVMPDEVLLLDDDLGVSLESLRRNWAASLFRTDTTMFTLPVFRQNNRRVLWEDGSMWGRFAGGSITGKREVIRPRFLRHGREIESVADISDLAAAHYPEYSTFIFQSLPAAILPEMGYPAAFFLRGDDIEYSLRGRAYGHNVISNPNMASWHEPAHSYGQEYMSISHGLIVNLCYGQESADTMVQFFLQRALSHLGIADPMGLELYATILEDIIDREMFLTHGFAPRYVQRLGKFRAFDQKFEQLPPEIIQELLEQSDPRHGQAEHHFFLYMTPERPVDRSVGAKKARKSKDLRRDTASRIPLTQVILTNPNNWTQYVYRPQEGAHGVAVARAAARLYAQIDHFATEFDALKAHYIAQLNTTMQADFWQEELSAWESSITHVTSGQRNG